MKIEKARMASHYQIGENVDKILDIFPNVITEIVSDDGSIKRAIDFDVLRQELSENIVEGTQERFQMIWPDKKKSILCANSSVNFCLRPTEFKNSLSNTKNTYIIGDNLDVLKVLRESYLHYFDVIYIDPPYNTGNNLIYKNDFHTSSKDYLLSSNQLDENNNLMIKNLESNGRFHTDWLNMIYPRLKVAKDLLAEDGVIILTIDDYEVEKVTMVMNEIFGEYNHLATIVIKNTPSGRSTVTGVSISHEYALFYGSTGRSSLGRLPRNEKQIARYKEKDNNGYFEWVNFRKHGGYKEDAPTMYYPIFIKKDLSSFRVPKIKWNEADKEYILQEQPEYDEIISYPIDENGRPRRWKWSLERALSCANDMCVRPDRDGVPAVYIKSRMNDEGMLPLTVWDDKKYSSTEYGTNLLKRLLGGNYFDYPKSLYAVVDCLRIGSEKKDAKVLDFFSGSSTTAHAVFELNKEDGGSRQFMMVQYPELIDQESDAYKAGYKTICDIAIDRIHRAGNLIRKESGILESDADVGFRIFKLDSSNMTDVYYNPKAMTQNLLEATVDNIKPDRTPLDLLFQVMLECGALLSSNVEERTINNKKVYVVENNYLVACFDDEVDNNTAEEIAKMHPVYACFKGSSFSNDSANINVEQIFKTYSPNTEKVKVI